jgi:hypothetical protein
MIWLLSVTGPSKPEDTTMQPEPIELDDDTLEDVSPTSSEKEKPEASLAEDGNPVDVEEGKMTDPAVS